MSNFDPSSKDYNPNAQSPLQNFQNPWDALGEYAQQFLNVDDVLNVSDVLNLDKILGVNGNTETKEPTVYKIPTEKSFLSSARDGLRRYYQALAYSPSELNGEGNGFTYGMECNASCMMYMLQSYGLIPPEFTRKEFEQVFTELTPFFYKHTWSSTHINRVKDHSQVVVYPRYKNSLNANNPNLFPSLYKTDILNGVKDMSNPTDFFLGKHDPPMNSIIPATNAALTQFEQICSKFYNLRNDKRFDFLKNTQKIAQPFKFINVYEMLQQRRSPYGLDRFMPVFAGVHAPGYVEGAAGHFSVIVGYEKLKKWNYQGRDYYIHLYLADDPLEGRVKVGVPAEKYQIEDLIRVCSEIGGMEMKTAEDEVNTLKNGDKTFIINAIYSNSAIALL